jgi:magnesium chelatase family protein
MLCKLISATLVGVDAALVDVEVDVTGGMPGFHLVGMPAGAVREGTVRIRAALQNAGYQLGPARITVNLAPADLRKQGAGFDLAIALGVLAGRRQRELVRDDWLYVGELSLSGSLKPIRGALAFAESAKTSGLAGIVVPEANAAEARLVEGIEVRGVDTLAQAVGLASGEELPPLPKTTIALTACDHRGPDFSEVAGQPVARRAAEIAAAGGHNLLLVGPPGGTMVLTSFAEGLPPSRQQEME